MDLTPGTVLLGKYRIDELIGTGGMGNVVRASHLYLHQPVAIKILLPQMAESASTVQRFLREAQATVKLRSEHTARVMDVGQTPDGAPFMVMEFLDGNDLNQILRHHGPQPPSIVIDLMLQACEGMAEAHALGIIHRDIKPSNFFITRRPDGSMLLKILDFGISKSSIGYTDLTSTQTVLGTPTYMAPEQMKSGRSADPRSDIWSLGVVMYQLITGRPPFAGESYAELVLKVGIEPPEPLLVPLPQGLAEIILHCFEKDPQQRHQTVGEVARLIAPYATDPIAASQTAARVNRILAQRGAQGMPGAQLAGGGLATPIPISPAQLTPRSWPPSHITSLSQGAGQVTQRTRANRGWMIAGVASLCLLAGVGGYALSQVTRGDRHEAAGSSAATSDNAAAASSTVNAAAPTEHAAPAASAAAPAASTTAASASTATPAAPPAAPAASPAAPAATATDDSASNPAPTVPANIDRSTAKAKPSAAASADHDTRSTKSTAAKSSTTQAATKPTSDAKSTSEPKHTPTKTTTKPAKSDDDLFGSRH